MKPIEELTHAARRRGFDVHPAPARLPWERRRAFLDWTRAGMHAGMAYLARKPEERADPIRRFSWFRGALVLSLGYAYPEPPRPQTGVRLGRVARYAWVRDYHQRIEPHLRALEELCARLGGRCRGYVDHGPVLERAYAAASGAGWIGRNGLWLTQRGGSYRHLAVLLTSWEVEPPPLHPGRCGRCSACVTACPTGAIVADGVVDARLCVSYWTIEHRGPVPLTLWDGIGDWLFGCDDCQSICPWNRRPNSSEPPADPELAWPDLETFFALSNKGFARRYAGSAFVRSGRRLLARNALIVLANRDPELLGRFLPRALTDPSPLVRQTAAAAAARTGRAALAVRALAQLTEQGRGYVRQALELFG